MLNWSLYQSSFSTPFMRKLWSQEAMIEAWLKVEKTLANCQAEQGLIPESAAQSLAKVTINDIDEKALLDKMQLVGRPIVGLVAQLRALVPEEDARYVHYLSTTQDIMDTACMLQMQLSVIEVKAQLDSLITKLDQLALEHASTQMMGRTNGQHAVVIHLGTKLAVLVAELERRRDNLQYAASHGLMVQVGGPVGDLSQYPEGKGPMWRCV